MLPDNNYLEKPYIIGTMCDNAASYAH